MPYGGGISWGFSPPQQTRLERALDDVLYYHWVGDSEKGYKKMEALIEEELGPYALGKKKGANANASAA